jgi:predicted Kef-type K+ transport protein
MLERLRQTLVESYVGAIALGYLLAQDIILLVNVFSSPIAAWAARRETEQFLPMLSTLRPQGAPQLTQAQRFPFENGLSSLMGFLVLLLLWYLLFRWLYFRPFQTVAGPTATEGE